MLNYKSSINTEIKHNDISIKEVSPIMKLNLRGKKREFFTTVGKHLDMILPIEANTSSFSSKLTSIWLSPDEWMIISNDTTEKDINKYILEENLRNSISKTNLGAVIDVTDHFVMLELEGANIYELFSSGSPFNFNEFKEKKGSTTQTLLNNIDVIIHNKGENLVNLFVRRSFSEHLYSWINDSASRL
ncbi:sarcosine oxidase subunit gamma family protein [Candidatus Pelagibacter bacterium]|jgi:sarcosine oxidase, subunit gamma|nr:sarcosine oxidase subunit gamma family protein [Candidatus Pelagibacter bacterium]